MNRGAIGIGSNIDPEKNIKESIKLLKEKVSILKISRFVKTAPVGGAPQPDYLNGAILVQTDLELEQLDSILKSIETKLNRVRTGDKFAPRTIDLDITVWNGTIVDKDFHEREFLKKAVLEVWPELKC